MTKETKISLLPTLSDVVEGHAKTLPTATGHSWETDPRHLGFNLSRYKFVSKMLKGYGSVLEVGCSDGFASHLVSKFVGNLTCIDNDPSFIKEAIRLSSVDILFKCHDILDEPLKGYDAVYSLDVIEHTTHPVAFIEALAQSAPVCIIGTPSLESQRYASEISRRFHINCMTSRELHDLMKKFYKTVFDFGMNDEVLHTGFDGMRHYLFSIGVK